LLDDVIALSRDEGEAEHAPYEDCDAAQAARTVARLMQPRAWEKQLRLTVTTAANLPRVAADPRRVRQVLLKLADNSVKFTQRGGVEISVNSGTREDGQSILRFAIADTGLGITPETAANIFETFVPGDNSYTRHNDGAGLGLAVARRVITTLGGAIGFSSEPGQGTTFWFEVPAVSNANVATQEPAAVTGDVAPPWGLSVLVWIGDGPVRTKVVNMIEPFGNRVVVATDIAGAIGLAGREAFDVVIVSGEDADSMAAAPGVNAPLLALVWNGTRTPAAASQILRWPAGAGGLYFALRDLLGRGADPGKATSDAQLATAMIDASAFAALEKSLGITTLIEILHAYTKTAEELCASLDEAAHGESWDIAARVAQDIAGSAGGLGLSALTAAARGFAQKARDSDDSLVLRRAAENVVNEHRRVRLALANLYPELAA
jgi:hypothetical protein